MDSQRSQFSQRIYWLGIFLSAASLFGMSTSPAYAAPRKCYSFCNYCGTPVDTNADTNPDTCWTGAWPAGKAGYCNTVPPGACDLCSGSCFIQGSICLCGI
jgi:hypothetical protein